MMDVNWNSDDDLKPLEAIYVADPRSASGWSPKTIEEHFSTVEPLSLSNAVPSPTRILWNTARNLYVYSWFVWRFLPVAELYGYAALENALREKCAQENSFPKTQKKKPKIQKEKPKKQEEKPRYNLGLLLKHALSEGWINVETLNTYKRMQVARSHSVDRALLIMGDKESAEAWVAALDPEIYRKHLEGLSFVRNEIAHGSSPLSPTVHSSLIQCHDLIQHLFS